MHDLIRLTATEAVAALAKGEVSPLELVEAAAARDTTDVYCAAVATRSQSGRVDVRRDHVFVIRALTR